MAIVTLSDAHQVWQIRAQWSSRGFAGGESSWSFVDVRYPGDRADHLYDLWVDHLEYRFATARPALWALERVMIEDRWPNTQAPRVFDYGGGISTDSDGDTAPPATTPLITWYTGHPGRSYRGRTYWGPIRAADIDAGWHLTGDAETAVYEFAVAMMATFGGSLDPSRPAFAIVSRTHEYAPRSPPVFALVSSFYDRQYLGVYRRRNRAPRIFV